jgi:hypothetical protein
MLRPATGLPVKFLTTVPMHTTLKVVSHTLLANLFQVYLQPVPVGNGIGRDPLQDFAVLVDLIELLVREHREQHLP